MDVPLYCTCTSLNLAITTFLMYMYVLPSSHLFKGNVKDIQQLFSAIDHRIEALKLNAEHSVNEAEKESDVQVRVSRESSAFDEEDKESYLEEVPSSPESPVETHPADIRQKAVSIPSSEEDGSSGCERGEGEREREREQQAGGVEELQQEGEEEESRSPVQQTDKIKHSPITEDK